MKYPYGTMMLEDGIIGSLDEWNDDKERVYGAMDMLYDYLWWEDSEGIHFIDRAYHDGINDEKVEYRRKRNELELNFNSISKALEWLDVLYMRGQEVDREYDC